jgi:hypothetical protein
MAFVPALIVTAIAVVMFRGLVEVVTRKLIPSPSLYGADQGLKAEDIIARRRYWYWRGKFRRLPIYVVVVLALLALCQLLLALGGVSAPFFNPFSGLKTIFPPSQLPQLGLIFVQLPMLFFINFAIFFGPFLYFAVRQIRGYEPGDASWGVKIDDVRGQAEAKEEITVQFLARKARKLAAKWGGQCIVFIDEIDAVGMRRQALQGDSAPTHPAARSRPRSTTSTSTAPAGR